MKQLLSSLLTTAVLIFAGNSALWAFTSAVSNLISVDLISYTRIFKENV